MRLGMLTGGRGSVGPPVGRPTDLVRLQGARIGSVPLAVLRGGPRPVDPDILETARVFSG